MHFADGDISAFVLMNLEPLVADRDLGRARYDDPMFRAMKVLLQ